MRTFAIGDVHGCQTALQTLLAQLALQAEDKLIFLGDLIDRGPDAKGVIESVLQLRQERLVEVIEGNHEEMLLLSRTTHDPAFARGETGGLFPAWLNFGGR